MMYGYGYGFLGMIIGLIITVAILAGLVALVIWVVRQVSAGSGIAASHMGTPRTPTEVLKMRYARGEITREQYQQMLEDLSR